MIVRRRRCPRLATAPAPRQLLVAVGLCLLIACGGSDNPVAPSPSTGSQQLRELEISGTTTFDSLRATNQLSAIARYADGSSENVTDRSNWQSSDPSVVTVSGTGLLTVRDFGEADVTATFQQLAETVRVVVVSPCAKTLSEPDPFNRHGGPGTVMIQTGEGCYWSARADVGWITLVGSISGSGPGAITFVVDPLPNGGSRSGRIVVRDQSVLVQQENTEGPEPHSSSTSPQTVATFRISTGRIPLRSRRAAPTPCGKPVLISLG